MHNEELNPEPELKHLSALIPFVKKVRVAKDQLEMPFWASIFDD